MHEGSDPREFVRCKFGELLYTGRMDKAEIQQGALQLPPEDRLEVVEAIWDSLEPDSISLPGWQKRLLDERIADAEANPEASAPWPEVRERIEMRLKTSQ